jgi:hypothetical protein
MVVYMKEWSSEGRSSDDTTEESSDCDIYTYIENISKHIYTVDDVVENLHNNNFSLSDIDGAMSVIRLREDD